MKILFICILFFSLSAGAETLVVKMRPTAGIMSTMSTKMVSKIKKLPGDLYILEGDLEKMKTNPDVEYVEKNIKFHTLGFPDRSLGTELATSWGIDRVAASVMWKKGFKGKGIRVAVIDTGVDGTHKELKGKVVAGYNAIDGSANAMDDEGHGTHVSGTIAGDTTGVAPEVTIVPVKFLDSTGSGSLVGAVKAIAWAMDANVQIMSNSWGGGEGSKALQDIIKAATAKGIYFVVASGNENNNNDTTPTYPAAYAKDTPGMISVAATDSNNKLAHFSNYGPISTLLAAPGVKIYSSVPGGKYDTWSGTSMAAPHFTGALAMILQSKCRCGTIMNCVENYEHTIPGLKDKVKLSSVFQFR